MAATFNFNVAKSEVERILSAPRRAGGKGNYPWSEALKHGFIQFDRKTLDSKLSSVYASAQGYANPRGKMVVGTETTETTYTIVFGDITPDYVTMIRGRKNVPNWASANNGQVVENKTTEPVKPLNRKQKREAKRTAKNA